MFLVSLCLSIFAQHISLRPVESFELERDEFFFSHPEGMVQVVGKHLFLMERDSVRFVVLDIESKDFVSFGDKGASPMGIANAHAFFVSNTDVTILSSAGKKITRFSFDGELLDTSRFVHPLYYTDEQSQLYQQGGEFIFELDGHVVGSSPFFDPKTFGFSKFSLSSGKHVLVVATASNSNQFQLHHFDAEQKQLVQSVTKDKVQTLSFEDIPMAKEAGFSAETFFITIFPSIGVADGALYLCEYMRAEAKDPAMEQKTLLHRYVPETQVWDKLIISHPGFHSFHFLLPYGDAQWIGFETIEDAFVVFTNMN